MIRVGEGNYENYKGSSAYGVNELLSRLPLEIRDQVISRFNIGTDILTNPKTKVNVSLLHAIASFLDEKSLYYAGKKTTADIFLKNPLYIQCKKLITSPDAAFEFFTSEALVRKIEKNHRYNILRCSDKELVYRIRTNKDFQAAMNMKHTWAKDDSTSFYSGGAFAAMMETTGKEIDRKKIRITRPTSDNAGYTEITIPFER